MPIKSFGSHARSDEFCGISVATMYSATAFAVAICRAADSDFLSGIGRYISGDDPTLPKSSMERGSCAPR
jgi:hypothetical protein